MQSAIRAAARVKILSLPVLRLRISRICGGTGGPDFLHFLQKSQSVRFQPSIILLPIH